MAWLKPPTAQSPHVQGVPQAKGIAASDKKDEIAKWYDRVAWRRFKANVLTYNPRCQCVVNGQQCTEPATVAHHIISPRVDRSLFLSWQNIVCICAEHHVTTEGERLTNPATYALTHAMFGATCDPNQTIAYLRGSL
jgi:hypothetical protein